MGHRIFGAWTAAVFGVLPVAALPLTVIGSYVPPKIVKQGASTSPVLGIGSVTVQVFVKADGTVGTVKIQKSTNHGDDAAALQIARASTYKPGVRGRKPIDAFYTLLLKFNGTSVTSDTGSASNEVNRANALVRANRFDAAKTALTAYLGAHPADRQAEALLGVADAYLHDPAGAAIAFDAAGTIPERFKVVAAKAYADAAVNALKAKNNDQAIALAGKALTLQANVNTLFIQGTAYANAQKYPQAIADLERAKAQATAGHADAATLNAIDASLATSYIFSGSAEKGLALARALKQRDPSNTRVDDTLAAYYNQQAVAALSAGRKEEAVTDLETGATVVPSRAVILYVQAANVLSQGTAPDWNRVKVEADKALALDPSNARANYVAGIALANQSNAQGAIPYLRKAKANAGSDASLNADIDTALKKLGQTP